MRNMRKEKLTLDAIKQDLLKVVSCQLSNKAEWRFSYIVPTTILAVMIGVILKNIFIGLLIFAFAAYHIVHYIIESREYKQNKKAVISLIDRVDISISTEEFSHIAHEIIYEPHTTGKHVHSTKKIAVYHFQNGASWRVPDIDKHYSWSREFYLSSEGLDNISVAGNEFFFVRLQNQSDIAYIYPCKLFELDGNLKK